MKEEQAQLIANFRYGMIAPVVVQTLVRGEQARIFKQLCYQILQTSHYFVETICLYRIIT